MAKYSPTQILGFSDKNDLANKLDQNFQEISTALENTLSRDGTVPNQMEADLDLNWKRIINVADPVSASDIATKGYVDNWVSDVVWKGPWSSATTYSKNDVVVYDDSTYICKYDNTTSVSGTPDVSPDWDLMAAKGKTPVWRGAWALNTAYNTLDMYEHNGASYVCKQGHISTTDTEPGVGASWSSYQDTMVIAVPADGSITTAKLADGSVTPPKIDSSQDFSFGQITSAGTDPRLILSEDDTTTVARVMLAGGVTYIQPGAVGFGTTASSGDLALCGLGYTDLGSFKVKTGGVWNNVWHDGNFAARVAALTENISPAGTESVACDDGKRVTLQAIADLASSSDIVAYSNTTNGYIKFSSGLVIQWGVTGYTPYYASGYGGTVTATYPITFPTAVFTFLATGQGSAGGTCPASPAAGAIGLSSHSIFIQNNYSSSQALRAHWLALGY